MPFYYTYAELPPGFENYVEEDETTLISVVFGKEKLGETDATFNDDEIIFDNPKQLLAKLEPFIKKTSKTALLKELYKTLPTNINRACKVGPKCGFIKPDILGVIFDRNNYRVYIFINPKYLQDQEAVLAKFLPDSTANFSILNQFQTNFSGNNQKNQSFAVNHNGFIGFGNWHLDYDDNYTYSVGPSQQPINLLQFKDLDLNWRHKQYFASVGLQDSVGTLIIPSLQIIGASFQTNTELLTNLNEQIATPVEVNTIVPSYVDVYRGNTLIDTQYFPPGNYFIDTRNFPSGAYILKLDIRTLTNQTTTKQVYFVKTTALPLVTLPSYYISFGRLAQITSDGIIPKLTDLNILTLQAKQRLHKSFGMAEHLTVLNGNEMMGELMFMSELNNSSFYISSALSNFGDTGLAVGMAGSIYDIAFNTYFRQIWVQEGKSNNISQYFEDTQNSNTNIGTTLFYNWHDYMFNLGLSYGYLDNSFAHNVEVGVTRTFILGENNSLTLSLSGDDDSQTKSVFLKLAWNFGNDSGWYGGLSSDGQIAQSNDQSESSREANIQADAGKEFTTKNTDSDVGINTQIDQKQQFYSQYANTSNHYFNALEQLNMAQSKTGEKVVSYNLKLGTSIAYAPISLWGVSSSTNKSGVLVDILADTPSKYTLYIDGKEDKTIGANESYFVPLPAYKTHNVQVQTHEIGLSILNPETDVTLYPGNIQSIQLTAKPAILLMGTFVSKNGDLLSDNSIKGGIELTDTDEAGFAQIDILQGAKLTLTDINGNTCIVDTRNIKAEDGVAFVDEVICD